MSQRKNKNSEDATTGTGNEPEIDPNQLYTCRKCGKQFTAAQQDAHRRYHQREKEKAKGQSSSKRPRRDSSPVRSEITLFGPINSPSKREGGGPRTPRRPDRVREPVSRPKRIESIKNYDLTVKPTKNPGN